MFIILSKLRVPDLSTLVHCNSSTNVRSYRHALSACILITQKGRCFTQIYVFYITQNQIVNHKISNKKKLCLYLKWRPLVPIQYQDIRCHRPNEDTIKRFESYLKQQEKWKKLYFMTNHKKKCLEKEFQRLGGVTTIHVGIIWNQQRDMRKIKIQSWPIMRMT